jgi:hypothetical protein
VSEGSAPGLPRLPFVGAEIDAIRAVAIQTGANLTDVITSPSSVAAVTAALPEANIVHFACHGLSDPENALGSGFCLHDGLLSIARIMRLQLKDAFFAFMCACDTTKGDTKARSQAIHLGAAMLFAGYKSVIGTLWYDCLPLMLNDCIADGGLYRAYSGPWMTAMDLWWQISSMKRYSRKELWTQISSHTPWMTPSSTSVAAACLLSAGQHLSIWVHESLESLYSI